MLPVVTTAWATANVAPGVRLTFITNEKERTYSKTWRKANIEKNRAKTNAYRKTNSKKYAAHNAVNNAIKRGDLPRVLTCDCVDCGIQAADYHHEDYSKPLDVEPLCRLCHVKRHNPDN
jgi:hypothetical protein